METKKSSSEHMLEAVFLMESEAGKRGIIPGDSCEGVWEREREREREREAVRYGERK